MLCSLACDQSALPLHADSNSIVWTKTGKLASIVDLPYASLTGIESTTRGFLFVAAKRDLSGYILAIEPDTKWVEVVAGREISREVSEDGIALYATFGSIESLVLCESDCTLLINETDRWRRLVLSNPTQHSD